MNLQFYIHILEAIFSQKKKKKESEYIFLLCTLRFKEKKKIPLEGQNLKVSQAAPFIEKIRFGKMHAIPSLLNI